MDRDKLQKMFISSFSPDDEDKMQGGSRCELYLNRKSERGIALVVVLVLSAVSLALITALLYMITIGTQTSGMHKRYQTALEAGVAGADIVTQVIGQRVFNGDASNTGVNTAITTFLNSLSGLNCSINANLPNNCKGTAYSTPTGAPANFTGLAAKLMTSTTSPWNNCGSTSLDADRTGYDFMCQVGTNPQFNVYAKIVDTVEGNSSPTSGNNKTNSLILNAVVGAGGEGGGEISTPSKPYLYTIEIDAENGTTGERAKLSVLYQF